MKLLFWIVICGNAAVLGLLFLLGLAAAPSSKTSPWAVAAALLVVPGLLIAGAILLFTRATSPAGRGLALVLAASPWLVALALRGLAGLQVARYTDAEGQMAWFPEGPLRDLAAAIARNDAVAVAALLPGVDVNAGGFSGTTLLMLALRQLATTPQELGCLRALLKAGADPRRGGPEAPLELAIRASKGAGTEPVAAVLAAGADANARDQFGRPVFFAATGVSVDPAVLGLLLDRGADLKAKDRSGLTALVHAANSPNWKAVMLLLQRGAEWKDVRNLMGLSFKDAVESHARLHGDGGGVADVIDYLRRH
jgi:hypothetical protein